MARAKSNPKNTPSKMAAETGSRAIAARVPSKGIARAAKPYAPKAASSGRRYWLFKSEPEVFSIDDLAKSPRKTTFWDGVRNYQARNFLRDDVKPGDGVLFYHSNADPLVIAGSCTVVKAGYPDHTAFDPHDSHFDPKSVRESPTWYMVDIQLTQRFDPPVARGQLQADSRLQSMMLLQRGSRLSIQPVTAEEWAVVHELASTSPQ